MASFNMEQRSLVLLLLLFFTFSFQMIHARDSQFFFSKTSDFEASPKVSSATSIAEEPATALPPQTNHNGYGLYGRDIDLQYEFPSTATTTNYNTNNAAEAYREPTTTPSSFTNAESSTAGSYENKEKRNANSDIPSTFTDAEFLAAESYKSKFDNPSSFGTNPEFPSQSTYENNIPSTLLDEQFNRGSYGDAKAPSYPNYEKKQYGMSDTRFLENGKYFYDVNAGRNSREYNSEDEGYENSAQGFMNQESQEEYVP